MPVLVILQGAKAGTAYPIEGEHFVLGRQRDCQLHEAFEQVAGVSRHHACIFSSHDCYYAEDLGSRNGTFHNGRRLLERTELQNGDQLAICGITFEFTTSETRDKARASATSSLAFDSHDQPLIHSVVPLANRTLVDTKIVEDPARKLHALVRLLGKTGESLDADEILDQLLGGLFDVFASADHGFVAVKDDQQGDIIPRAVRHREAAAGKTIRVSRTVVDRVMTSGETILSLNASSDARFEASRSILENDFRSLMCAPLVDSSGKSIGVIQLDTMGEGGQFDRDDLEVLASITPHASRALDYARIHAEEMQRQALQYDLQFARQVQRHFLPQREPQLEGYEFSAYYEAAYHVGGDYYDYIDLSDGRLGVIVADVAGKGISAALLMSKFAGEFKYLLSREESLSLAVTRMNDILYADAAMSRFITLVAAVLDPASHELILVNAGHTDPLLRHPDGQTEEIGGDQKGTPIGMFPDQKYEAAQISLGSGDTVVMYTDGLSEATRADESLYGKDRIQQQVSSGPQGAVGLGQHILEGVNHFVGEHPQSDDMCVICVHRNAN